MRRLVFVGFVLLVACSTTSAPSPLERTMAEGSARFRLAVGRNEAVARAEGVLALDGSRMVVTARDGLVEDGPTESSGLPLAELVDGADVETDRRGRIVRVVRREGAPPGPDVVITLELFDFGAPVVSG